MTQAERRFYRAMFFTAVAILVTACAIYSMLPAHAQAGPIIIPTPTMHPAPTPGDGDDFLIMTPVQWLPIVVTP